MSRVGLSSKQTTGRFGSGACSYRSSILHASDVLAVDMRNAPHVLAPRLEVVFGQPTAHYLPGDAVMLGEPDQFIRQQLQGPTGATLRWVGTGGRDQQGFLFARELAGRARTRLFTQRLFQIAHQEAAHLVRYTVDPPTPTLIAMSSSPA